MLPLLGLGLLDAGVNAIGSLLGFGSSMAYNSQQREMFDESMSFNKEQADVNRTFAHNEASLAFQREADYNSYKSQLSRMRDAGINPNSINQQLSSSANSTAASGTSASAPSMPNMNFYDLGANVKSVIGETFQNYLLRKQADKTGKESERIESLLPYEVSQIKAAIDKTTSEMGLNKAQITQLQRMLPLLEGKADAEIKQIIAATEAAVADKNLKEMQAKGVNLDNLSKEVTKEIAAKYGIVIDQSGMTALITALLTPHGSEVVSKMLQNLGKGLIYGVRDGTQGILRNILP